MERDQLGLDEDWAGQQAGEDQDHWQGQTGSNLTNLVEYELYRTVSTTEAHLMLVRSEDDPPPVQGHCYHRQAAHEGRHAGHSPHQPAGDLLVREGERLAQLVQDCEGKRNCQNEVGEGKIEYEDIPCCSYFLVLDDHHQDQAVAHN